MILEITSINKIIYLTFNKNENGKYKMAIEDYNIQEILEFLLDCILNNKLKIKLNNVIKEIIFDKMPIINLIYYFLTEEINKNLFNKEISLIILEYLLKNDFINQEEIEIRFFTDRYNNKINETKHDSFEIFIKNKIITTDLLKVLVNNDNMYNISFKNDYIKDLKIENEEIIDIYTIKNKNENENVIYKKIKVLNFYYDELNNCYFISGKYVQ